MDLRPYFGKNVIVTDVDNIIYKGFVAVGTIPGDSDDNCYEIDLIGTKQYGDSYFTLMTIWRKSPYFSEGMDSLSLGLVESYFLYALYFWSLIYLSTTSLLMLPREPR